MANVRREKVHDLSTEVSVNLVGKGFDHPFEVIMQPFPTAIKRKCKELDAMSVKMVPFIEVLLPEAAADEWAASRAW